MIENLASSVDTRTDQSGIPQSPEKPPTPYRIRGHHIDQYIYLINGSQTPESTALGQKEAALWYLKHGLKDGIFDFVAYAVDIIGLTPWQARRFVHTQQKVFEKFLSLPPDYPIELVEGVKDEMCNDCIFGRHCRVRYTGQSADALEVDGWDFDLFLKKAESLSLENQMTIDQERADFSDTPPTNVRILKTSMEIFSTVLTNWDRLTTNSRNLISE